MPYQPFLIAPFKSGLDTDIEPWLAPVDAFTEITNGHIHHGYVEKRQGYRFLASVVHGQVISAATAASPAVFTPNSINGLWDGQTVSLHYLEDGGGAAFSGLNAQKYTLTNIDQGAGTFELLDLDGNAINTSGTYTANSGRLGTFEQVVETQTVSSATAAAPAVFTVASIGTIVEGDFVVLRSLTGGTWSTLNATGGTATNVSGATFSVTKTDGSLVSGSGLGTLTGGSVDKIAPSRVMGLFRYVSSDNTRILLAADKERTCIYNGAANLLEPLDIEFTSGTTYPNNDHFAGSNTDFIWAANWQNPEVNNRVYITNGKAWTTGTPGTDGLYYYDQSTAGAPAKPVVVQFRPQVSSTGPTLVYGSKMIFSIKNRLLLLHTIENDGATTYTYPQRARWCASQDPSNWDQDTAGGGGFVDAPTGEQIISARQLQDVIIVNFTDSVWTLRPVPDPALPFRWDQINSFRSCDGRMATVGFDRYSLAVGIRGITATDGVETRRVDDRIEDFTTDDINDSQFEKVFGDRSYGTRRTWLLYPSKEAEDSDASLIFDDESGAYSQYDIVMNCLGHGGVPIDYAAQDFTSANDLDIAAADMDDETALSFFWSEKAEIFLGGDFDGKVHLLETGVSDDGSPIAFDLRSAAWNPYKEESLDCQFGYIDFYVDADQKTKLDIAFYKNNEEAPYKSQSLDCLPNLNYRSSVAEIEIKADPSDGFTVTSNSHGLVEGDTFYLYGVEGADFYNDQEWTVGATVTENSFDVDTDITGFAAPITGLSQATTAVVTSVAHPFSIGDRVYITQVGGMIEVNDIVFTVGVTTTDTFQLLGIDSSAYTAYTSGGYVFYDYLSGGKIVERKFYRTKVWKRAYAGGTGYQHGIKIEQAAAREPFKLHGAKPWFQPRGKRILG